MGSLAPQANISREEWRLAGFNPNSIQWHVDDQAPATVTSRVAWWPMAIPVVLLVTGGVIQFYRHRFKRYLRKRLGGAHLH